MILRRIIAHFRKQEWTAIGIDFVIVVVGVFVGLQVSNWNEERTAAVRREQIVATLVADLRDSQVARARFETEIEAGLTNWQSAVAADEAPPPFYYRIEGSDTPPRTWSTLQQMPLADMLDPVTLFDLAFYYSEMDGVGAKYVRYVVFVEDEILPNLRRDAAVFYTADRSALRPEYAANQDRLREWVVENQRLRRWAHCLIYRIESGRRFEQSCRRADFTLEGMPDLTEATP